MRTRMAVMALVLAFATGVATGAEESIEQRMKRFEQRLDEMEAKHKTELKQRDDEIARLRAEVEKKAEHHDDGHEGHVQAAHADATTRQSRESARDILDRLDPQIAVVADLLGTFASSKRSNDAYNRVDVRETVLELRGHVHPRADGVAIFSFARDVENPVFPGDDRPEGPESSARAEEAYLYIHDTGVPGLTATVGRFQVMFGRQNQLHLHELPTADPSLVNQAFLAPESLIDAGVSLTYAIPNPWDHEIKLTAELISGEGESSESPTLAGDLSVDSPAFNLHAHWNAPISADWTFELGASWLRGHADADNARDVNLLGLDATLLRHGHGRLGDTLLQAELMYGLVDQPTGDTEHALGAYLLAQQTFNHNWHAGLRLDWTEDPNDASREAFAVSPYLTWNWNDNLRLRVQYQRRGGDVPEENILFLQATWTFGNHAPHHDH
jgi:hypothetical protein